MMRSDDNKNKLLKTKIHKKMLFKKSVTFDKEELFEMVKSISGRRKMEAEIEMIKKFVDVSPKRSNPA
jgi:mannitol/fructose-specific phosphotransferase system IIA component